MKPFVYMTLPVRFRDAHRDANDLPYNHETDYYTSLDVLVADWSRIYVLDFKEWKPEYELPEEHTLVTLSDGTIAVRMSVRDFRAKLNDALASMYIPSTN